MPRITPGGATLDKRNFDLQMKSFLTEIDIRIQQKGDTCRWS